MTTEMTYTYDQLCEDPPEGWSVDKHQSYADTGVVIVAAPGGSILDGLALAPGKQVNVTLEDDKIVAYNVGPDDATPKTTNTAKEAEASPVGTTPQPQAPSEHPTPEPQRASDEGETDGHDASHKDPAKVTDQEWPKETGSGWYELSNGEKVRGQEDAEQAQAKLDA